MNLKKRGITVGDLLLFIVLLIVISFISLKFKERNKQSYLLEPFSLIPVQTFQS